MLVIPNSCTSSDTRLSQCRTHTCAVTGFSSRNAFTYQCTRTPVQTHMYGCVARVNWSSRVAYQTWKLLILQVADTTPVDVDRTSVLGGAVAKETNSMRWEVNALSTEAHTRRDQTVVEATQVSSTCVRGRTLSYTSAVMQRALASSCVR